MSSTKGTPKKMEEAITNGLLDYCQNNGGFEKSIEKHVRDFIAQKFSVALLRSKDPASVKKLWKEITGRELL